jgi:dolichol kinase
MLWSDTIGSRTTHSTPIKPRKTSEGAAARAIAWILNAVLLTVVASGFAISAAGYSVAMWSATYDLLVGRTERALNQKDGHAEPR